jgi:hypothetical protein
MPKAKRRPTAKALLKPRNPLARHPLMGKGAAHEPRGKNEKRARLRERLRKLMQEGE